MNFISLLQEVNQTDLVLAKGRTKFRHQIEEEVRPHVGSVTERRAINRYRE
ncbi:hypothetical protein CU098_003368 [Rhizopus stolonifer]|uniref:Uncharacterized protein n=1 Tax=Rhizopus stolonifer TaxID=4846 RepID=A0A367IQ78_RHIST|nr:hypothetical protein CU098_003368 [Rhizopus stolonifer]